MFKFVPVAGADYSILSIIGCIQPLIVTWENSVCLVSFLVVSELRQPQDMLGMDATGASTFFVV